MKNPLRMRAIRSGSAEPKPGAHRVVAALVVVLGLVTPAGTAAGAQTWPTAAEYCVRLGRGVNLGNALDAPREGEWGFRLQAEYFPLIKAAGFQSIRLPVRWSAHAGTEPPYTLDQVFLKRVRWAVDAALAEDLAVVLNVHHYNELMQDPGAHEPRLQALWQQIAAHFQDHDGRLSFELLNEPHDKLTPVRWQDMLGELLATVRASNPERIVLIGAGDWNGLRALAELKLPAEDRRLIATFHYYLPFEFTHQGASWVEGSDRWRGRTWTAEPDEVATLERDFDRVAAWSKDHERPVYLGEFGAYSAAPAASRATWTRAVARAAEARGWGWSYWEFGSGFGVYDPRKNAWHDDLKAALLDVPAL